MRDNPIVKRAMEIAGVIELTPEVGAALRAAYQTWSGRPTKRNHPATRVAGVQNALARLATPGHHGMTEADAVEQVRRAML